MKITPKKLMLCALTALGLSAAGSASAVSILQFGGSTVLVPGSPGTADSLTDFRGTDGSLGNLSVVNGSTGIFASLPVGTNFSAFAPFVIDPLISVPLPFFSFEDEFTYELDPSSVTFNQGGSGVTQFLNIFGDGTIFGPEGFELDAHLALSVSGVADDGRISIQGNLVTQEVPVPEGGSAMLLLGLGLLGVETLRRRLVKERA